MQGGGTLSISDCRTLTLMFPAGMYRHTQRISPPQVAEAHPIWVVVRQTIWVKCPTCGEAV
jgi:hypothetical protein